jgi:hypothetical protein
MFLRNIQLPSLGLNKGSKQCLAYFSILQMAALHSSVTAAVFIRLHGVIVQKIVPFKICHWSEGNVVELLDLQCGAFSVLRVELDSVTTGSGGECKRRALQHVCTELAQCLSGSFR